MSSDPAVAPGVLASALVEAASALGVGVVVVAGESALRFLYVGAGMEPITGYSTAELLALDPVTLAHPTEVARLARITRRHAATSTVDPRFLAPTDRHFDTILVRKDGQLAEVEAAVSSIELGSERVAVVFIVDVTRSKQTERLLRRAEARSRTLLDRSPEAIWALDRDRVLYANAACLALFGYDPGADFADLDPRTLLHPEDVHIFEKRAFTMLALGQVVPPCEYRVRRHDGESMVIEVSSVVGEFEGRPAIFSFGRDVTARRHAETRRLQADRLGALGLLAGGMAHAINNPLTYVLLNLDHVAVRLPEIPTDTTLLSEVLVRLTEARDGAERVAGVVRQMRALSRTEDQEQGQINVREVIKNAAGMVGHEIRHRGSLHLELSDVPPVFGNAARLEQVFLNLLVFITRALPERDGGEVRLRLYSSDRSTVVAEIAYDGPEMDPRVRLRALDADLADDTFTEREASGLSLCNGIVRALGGSMHIDSTIGGGTTFRVVLPVDTRDAPHAPSHPRLDSEPPASLGLRARVMVIDDDAGVVQALRVMLEDEHDVTCVASGRDALRLLLRDDQYDVVFCDLMMPDVSGMDLFEALRLNRPGRERGLVFMTGGAFTREAVRFLQHVPNPRLDKPFDMRTLTKLLRRVVNANRAASQRAP